MASIVEIIESRRDGRGNTPEELQVVVEAAARLAKAQRSEVAEYQLASWLMAAFFQPLSRAETVEFTRLIAHSGDRVDLTGLPRPWFDKHSTGGVGDKTTLVVLPILAACGLTVAKMSGRGLGITGGTVDKLASIPGFRTDLSPLEMREQAQKIGIALSGQSPALAPADKALYALRDVTATVPSLPLIVSSILSKKVAGGAERVVFDVKVGSGAFMKTLDQARELAYWLVEIGQELGLKCGASLTDMSQPLGRTVGNALEVWEAGQVLNGQESRFQHHAVELASQALSVAFDLEWEEARSRALESLISKAALAKAEEWVAAQGGDPNVWSDPSLLALAPAAHSVAASSEGWVESIDAEKIGRLALEMGAGRHKATDSIDHSVGVEILAEVGEKVVEGQEILRLRCGKLIQEGDWIKQAEAALKISKEERSSIPVVFERITGTK